jgi:hypothetical protein
VGDIFDWTPIMTEYYSFENNCTPIAGYDGYWSLIPPMICLVMVIMFNLEQFLFSDGKKGTHSAGSSNYLQYSNGSFLSVFSYSMWVKPSSLSGIQTILRREAPSMVLLFG